MRLTFTQDDILRGKILTPGWYPLEIFAVTDITAASSGASGAEIDFKVLSGPFAGVPVKRNFYESGVGFAKPLLESLGAEVKAGSQFDLDEKLVGKRVEGYVKNSQSNKGNVFNDLTDFRPIRTATPKGAA